MTPVVEHRHHWSVAEANAALEYVGPKLDRLRELMARLSAPAAEAGLSAACAEVGGGWPGRDAAAASLELALGLNELEQLDIVVRDLERGLIDFPALRDGEEVYLCWLRGEPRVAHWHSPEAGFAGRQPL